MHVRNALKENELYRMMSQMQKSNCNKQRSCLKILMQQTTELVIATNKRRNSNENEEGWC